MTDEYDLYGGTPPHEKASATSRLAAEQILADVTGLRLVVLNELVKRGAFGATDRELETATGLRHETVSARRRELYLKGHIVKAGVRRPTPSGRMADVYRAKENHGTA